MSRLKSGNLAWTLVGDYLVFVHTAVAPTDDEWKELLTKLRVARDKRRVRVLVYTQGGAPNARQRALLNQAVEHVQPPIAVVTHSNTARAAGTAIGWFNPRIKVFDPSEQERAFDHLDANSAERKLLSLALRELRAEIGAS